MREPSSPPLRVTTCEPVSIAVVLVRRGAAAAASRALQAQHALELPAPGRLIVSGSDLLLWNGPDRFLAVRNDARPGLAQALATTLGAFAHVVDASSGKIVLAVTGNAAPEALNRLLPIDLHPDVFTAGSVALTTAGHIDMQIWRPGADLSYRLACGTGFAGSFRRQLIGARIG